MPPVPVIWKAEAEESGVPGQPGQHSETASQKTPKRTSTIANNC